MSKRLFVNIFILIGVFITAAGLIVFPSETANAAKDGLKLCAECVIPSLFPFFVLSGVILESGMARYAGRTLEGVMRPAFHLNGACATAVVLGIIGGYPIGAVTAVSLYQKKLCTKDEAEHLLGFCNNSGPAFILGAVGAGIFKNAKLGILLFLIHILSSLTLGIILGFTKRRNNETVKKYAQQYKAESFSVAFSKAIQSGLKSSLNISAFVVFFAVIIKLLDMFYVIPSISYSLGALLSPVGLTPNIISKLLTGAVEVTTGLSKLTDAGSNLTENFILAAFLLGWAGLSIHCQVLSFVSGSGLSMAPYLWGKLLHGILSACYALLISLILPLNSSQIINTGFFTKSSVLISPPIRAIVFFLFLSIIILIIIFDFYKKVWKKEIK